MPYDISGDAILSEALAYWRSKRAGRAMPQRRDIDPCDIPRLLPHVQITELVDGGARVRYRLSGTAVTAMYGAELAGRYFDEVFSGERLKFIEDNYRTMCREKHPILVRNRYLSLKEVEFVATRLVMPLSEDGACVNQALTAITFHFLGEVKQSDGAWLGIGEKFDFGNSFCEILRG